MIINILFVLYPVCSNECIDCTNIGICFEIIYVYYDIFWRENKFQRGD